MACMIHIQYIFFIVECSLVRLKGGIEVYIHTYIQVPYIITTTNYSTVPVDV